MEKTESPARTTLAHKISKIAQWAFLILILLFCALWLIRVPFVIRNKMSAAQVIKIHNTKLTIDDVMGKNLPPDPGAVTDKTVAGIDANKNGIRDDVELAVFKEYPNSAKTRAVLLQYALALQMEVIQPIVAEDNVIAAVQEEDRAYACVGKILNKNEEDQSIMKKYFSDWDKLILFVEEIQFNTPERKNNKENFLEKIGSYNSLPRTCDIDYSTLPN